MAVGLASGIAEDILDALCRSVTWTEPAAVYIQLHDGDPGAAGTSNIATETTRVQATFGNAAVGGTISNSAAIEWTNVAGSETYTHYSAHDASTAGNFLWSDDLTASAVTAGDDFSIDVGALDVSLTAIAA